MKVYELRDGKHLLFLFDKDFSEKNYEDIYQWCCKNYTKATYILVDEYMTYTAYEFMMGWSNKD